MFEKIHLHEFRENRETKMHDKLNKQVLHNLDCRIHYKNSNAFLFCSLITILIWSVIIQFIKTTINHFNILLKWHDFFRNVKSSQDVMI